MVLGLRSKNKKGASIQLDYIVHLQEIKPWPPSQSLKSLRSVVLQWENGDRNAGSTPPVVPSPGEGKIEFNERFKLHVTLSREASGRGGGDSGPFQKSMLELNLYEPRRDKPVKGQHLGSAMVDLAEHGVITEPVSITTPLSCKRSFRNTAQPLIYLRIQPFDRDRSGSSSRESPSNEASLERQGSESVSALMSEEYAEEAEIASFTDDDASSHSSPASEAVPVQNCHSKVAHDTNVSQALKEGGRVGNVEANLGLESVPEKPESEGAKEDPIFNGSVLHWNRNLPNSSTDLSADTGRTHISDMSLSSSPQTLILKKEDTTNVHLSSSVACNDTEDETTTCKAKECLESSDFRSEVQENMVDCRREDYVVENHVKKESDISGITNQVEVDPLDTTQQKEDMEILSFGGSQPNVDDDQKAQRNGNLLDEVASNLAAHDMFVERNNEHRPTENGPEAITGESENHSIEIECLTDNPGNGSSLSVSRMVLSSVGHHGYLQNGTRMPLSSDMATFSRRVLGVKCNSTLTTDKPENMLSLRSAPDTSGSIYTTSVQYMEDVKEIDVLGNVSNSRINSITNDRTDDQDSTSSSSCKVKHGSRINRNSFSTRRVRELELKVEMLEKELREAAAVEISLYSIVAEHGRSAHKVHTSARRLSRLYIHASKQLSHEKRASASRSAASGLFLAAKACGNDVSRLTFWLSNSVVLRALIAQSTERSNLVLTASPYPAANGSQMASKKKSSLLKWESPHKKDKFSFAEDSDDWEDPYTFLAALERVEAWIFSRIVESMWWQTLAPHMQLVKEGCESKLSLNLKKSFERPLSLGEQKRANSSIEIWKKAFKDACERLCPVRAGGHECGCLSMLSRLPRPLIRRALKPLNSATLDDTWLFSTKTFRRINK